MKPLFTMRQALNDPALLGATLAGPSWLPWRVMLISVMGERLKASERVVFERFTGRTREPGRRVEEAAFVIGRRGGKDRAASILAVYLSGLCDHRSVLAPGEKGVIVCVAADQRQARITLGYVVAAFESAPILKRLIKSRTADTLELTNGISVEVRAASFRRIRGVTALAVIGSEVAFWMDAETSNNPDTEILNAARPALATTSGPLILISSPYARKGELWSIYRQHYGAKGDPLVLVAKGTSKEFNPTLSQRVIDRAYERDAIAASAEYGGSFRADVESFVSRAAVQACVPAGRHEMPPVDGTRYVGFVDPSGGSKDSFTLCIAHKDKHGRVILDCIRERRPPFAPSEVVKEFAATLADYGITKIKGDHYAGEWPREQFKKRGGITYEPCPDAKSDLYLNALPKLNSGQVELLDHPKLINQLCGLERRTARSGRDSIDHAPGGHDDVCNAAAGAIALAAGKTSGFKISPEAVAWAKIPYRRGQTQMPRGQRSPVAVSWNRNSSN
jgi:hypothetical protein